MKNLCASLFCHARVALMTMCIAAAAFPPSADALWWVAAKKVVSEAVKPDHKPKRTSRNKRDYQARGFDGYNPYHAHPDGRRSIYFNERDGRGW